MPRTASGRIDACGPNRTAAPVWLCLFLLGMLISTFLLSGPPAHSGGYWTIQALPLLPNSAVGSVSTPLAINRSGEITGICGIGISVRGFLFANGTMTDLGDFLPFKMNDYGQIVSRDGKLWTPTIPQGSQGTLTQLPLTGFEATDINQFGQICARDAQKNGVLWTPSSANGSSGTITDLGFFPARDLNDYGQIICEVGDLGNLWMPDAANATTGFFLRVDTGGLFPEPLRLNHDGSVLCSDVYTVLLDDLTDMYGAFVWVPNSPNGTTTQVVEAGPTGDRGGGWNATQIFGDRHTVFTKATEWDCDGDDDCSSGRSGTFLWTATRGVREVESWRFPVAVNDRGDAIGAAWLLRNDEFRNVEALVPAVFGWKNVLFEVLSDSGWIAGTGVVNGQTRGFILRPTPVTSLTFDPNPVYGSHSTTGHLTLSTPAPSGGARLLLRSAKPEIVSVPDSVVVPGGASSVEFVVSTPALSNTTDVLITAEGEQTVSATLRVRRAPAHLTLTPDVVPGSEEVKAVLTLRQVVGADTMIPLGNTNSAASVPASVTVPAGTNTTTFQIPTTAVTSTTIGQVTATYEGVTETGPLTVRPIQIQWLALQPNPVPGGANATATVTLEAPAPPGGMTVFLSSKNPALAKPLKSGITIPAGGTAANFTLATQRVSAATEVEIRASANGASVSRILTVRPIRVKAVTIKPNPVVGGAVAMGTVELEAPAGPAPISVQLTSSAPGTASPDMPSITIPVGSATATFTISTQPVSSNRNVIISATAQGFAEKKSVTLSVLK